MTDSSKYDFNNEELSINIKEFEAFSVSDLEHYKIDPSTIKLKENEKVVQDETNKNIVYVYRIKMEHETSDDENLAEKSTSSSNADIAYLQDQMDQMKTRPTAAVADDVGYAKNEDLKQGSVTGKDNAHVPAVSG